MKCEVCLRTLDDGVSLYRVNPIGQVPAVWRCECHVPPEQRAEVDPDVQGILGIIREDNQSKG